MFQVMCDWSITSVPLSSRCTLVGLAIASPPPLAQRLADAHELARALLLELLGELGRVVEEAAARLDAEAALVVQLLRCRRDAALIREVLVEIARDARVDVEPRHVEQMDRRDHRELVA